MEIYPGAGDLHTLTMRTKGCRDMLPSLTHCCTTSMSLPRETTARKIKPEDELRGCARFKTEWAARTASMA